MPAQLRFACFLKWKHLRIALEASAVLNGSIVRIKAVILLSICLISAGLLRAVQYQGKIFLKVSILRTIYLVVKQSLEQCPPLLDIFKRWLDSVLESCCLPFPWEVGPHDLLKSFMILFLMWLCGRLVILLMARYVHWGASGVSKNVVRAPRHLLFSAMTLGCSTAITAGCSAVSFWFLVWHFRIKQYTLISNKLYGYTWQKFSSWWLKCCVHYCDMNMADSTANLRLS